MNEILTKFGIETRVQFAIAVCVISLVIVTTVGGSGGTTPVFFIFRSLLLAITILCVVACRNEELRIAPLLLAAVAVALALMLVSMLRGFGCQLEGVYVWFK